MMKNLTVALIEPMYEVNTGLIARVMKNFGVEELLLVNSRVNLDEAKKFASHGADLLEKVKEVRWQELMNFDLLVGTTAIAGTKPSNILRDVVNLEELAEDLIGYGRVCLLFGRETTGLNNEELEACDLVVSIPTGTGYRTLNVSHSVAILLYELSRASKKITRKVAQRKDRERVLQYALRLAEVSGFPAHKLPLMKQALRRIMTKGRPSPRELFLLMGLLRRATLALRRADRTTFKRYSFKKT